MFVLKLWKATFLQMHWLVRVKYTEKKKTLEQCRTNLNVVLASIMTLNRSFQSISQHCAANLGYPMQNLMMLDKCAIQFPWASLTTTEQVLEDTNGPILFQMLYLDLKLLCSAFTPVFLPFSFLPPP